MPHDAFLPPRLSLRPPQQPPHSPPRLRPCPPWANPHLCQLSERTSENSNQRLTLLPETFNWWLATQLWTSGQPKMLILTSKDSNYLALACLSHLLSAKTNSLNTLYSIWEWLLHPVPCKWEAVTRCFRNALPSVWQGNAFQDSAHGSSPLWNLHLALPSTPTANPNRNEPSHLTSSVSEAWFSTWHTTGLQWRERWLGG